MPSTKKKYYYLVVPLVKTGLSKTSFFTYHSREKISPGSLVEIPFGKKVSLESPSSPPQNLLFPQNQ